MLDRIGERYRAFLVRVVDCCRRAALWVVLAGLTAAGLSLWYAANNLTLDTDPMNLLDPDLPFRRMSLAFDAAFPQLDDLIVVVVDQGSPERRRDAVHELARLLERRPALISSVYQPQQDDFFDQHGLLYFDVDELWRFDERLTKWEPFLGTLVHDPSLRGLFSMLTQALEADPTPEQWAQLAKVFDGLHEAIDAQRLGKPYVSSWRQAMLEDVTDKGDPSRGFLLVKPKLDYSSLEAAEGPIEFLRQRRGELEDRFGVRIRLTGPVPIEADERETIARGAGLTAGLSLGLVAVVLIVGLRSLRLVAAMVATLVVGLLWTAWFVTAAIGSLNLITASAPVLFIGLGVDFGIQLGMRYREEFARIHDHEVALRRAAEGVGGALTLAAVAAALSFFSFLPTSYRGFAELGLIAGGGMFMALVANVTFFPALMTLFPLTRAVVPPANGLKGDATPSTVLILRYRRVILGALVPVMIGAIAVLPTFKFDVHPLHLRDPSSESVSTFQELLADTDTSPYIIQVLANGLQEADALADRLKSVPEVDHVVTLSSFVPNEQEEKLAIIDELALVLAPILTPQDPVEAPSAAEEVQALTDFRTTLAAYAGKHRSGRLHDNLTILKDSIDHLLADSDDSPGIVHDVRVKLIGDFPRWLGRLRTLMSADAIDLETLPDGLRNHYLSQDGRTRVEIFPAQNVNDNEALRRFVDRVQQIVPRASGSPVGILEGGRAIVIACVQATLLAVAASAALLFVVLRRPREVLLVLLPLVLTMILTVAACLVLGVPLNLANVIAVPLVLGLGIAFGVYLVLRRREQGSLVQVVRSSTARAVLFSALTTMASFGALSVSRHPGMASLGLLLVVALTLALVCALVVLPALMAELEERGWWIPSAHQE